MPEFDNCISTRWLKFFQADQIESAWKKALNLFTLDNATN